MAEKKVGKGDNATVAIRVKDDMIATVVCAKENGDKIVARSSIFTDDCKAVVLAGQVLEVRREQGSVVFVIRDRPVPPDLAAVQGLVNDLDWENETSRQIALKIMALFGASP